MGYMNNINERGKILENEHHGTLFKLEGNLNNFFSLIV